MSKLFALEELDEVVDAGEMEASVEEGEVADVQVDVEEEVAEVGSQETAIDDGMGAAGQLEEIEDVVEASIEEGEGLDPVAAEAVRIAVEAICARVGANPKSMYALYATENFQSASSRKANSRIALEGISDFLKSLWEKIKAAVSNIWTKVTEFWNKHVSNLGRVLKALESMKSKISATKGSPNQGSDEVKASSGLVSTFAGKGDVSTVEINNFISAHTKAAKSADTETKVLMQAVSNAGTPNNLLPALSGVTSGSIKLGEASAPLAGGVYLEYKYEIENDKSTEEDGITFKFEVEEESADSDKERDLYVAGKDALKKVVQDTIVLIKASVKTRDTVDKDRKEFEKVKKDLDKLIGGMSAADATEKLARRKAGQALRTFSTIHAKVPGISAKLAAMDVRLAKGVLEYCSACLKRFK